VPLGNMHITEYQIEKRKKETAAIFINRDEFTAFNLLVFINGSLSEAL